MIANIHCPVCNSSLDLAVSVKMRTRTYVSENGNVHEKRELLGINVKKIEAVEDRWSKIIENVHPYIRPGLTIDALAMVLVEEYSICTVHVPLLIEKIKDAYGLYARDGKTLEKI